MSLLISLILSIPLFGEGLGGEPLTLELVPDQYRIPISTAALSNFPLPNEMGTFDFNKDLWLADECQMAEFSGNCEIHYLAYAASNRSQWLRVQPT